MTDIKIVPVGDRAILVNFGDIIDRPINARVTALAHEITRRAEPGIIDLIPTFTSVLINYDPLVLSYEAVADFCRDALGAMQAGTELARRIFEIPVIYGGEFGEDLAHVAEHAGLTEEEVIAIHTGTDYLIYMLGFLPGFAYLGGLDERIVTPRLKRPRVRIPAGAVGIGGSQTGIYPTVSPGGWQLIGLTPVVVYDPARTPAILYEAGDLVRFRAVDRDEYEAICRAVAEGSYEVRILKEEA